MAKSIPAELSSMLQATIQKAGKKAPVTEARKVNIGWIQSLPRENLEYQRKEKQVLIHTTNAGEKIFIQYPGKESIRKDDKKRPWDFRPKLYIPRASYYYDHKDMSFGDIWDTIEKIVDELVKGDKKKIVYVFATLLYRMAFMLDHIKVEPFNTKTRDVIYKNNELEFSAERNERFPALCKYWPNKQILGQITGEYPQWGEMSFEGFLFYNDLLAWNEDCKFYYRNSQKSLNKKKSIKWINETGRVNTLLTCIRILGYRSGLGNIRLSVILNDYSKKRGVSPASDDEVMQVCGGLVKAE